MEDYFGFAKELLDAGKAIEQDSYGEDNLYDINIDETHDFDFFLQLANGGDGKVLDVGCGTGRTLLPLLKAGYDVTGVDISPAMLQIAEKKLDAASLKTTLLEGDMRELDFEMEFSLVIIPNCSMIYIQSDGDRRKVFQSAYKSLKPGGMLAFDFDTEKVSADVLGPWLSSQAIHPATGEVIVSTVQMKGINEQLRLINMINYRYKGTDQCALTVNASYEATCDLEKMKSLLEEEGFQLKGVYGDYQSSPYEGGELCVVVAEKQ